MSHAPNAPLAVILGETQVSTLGALRWLSPVIIGLCAPMVLGLVVFPGLVEDARFMIGVVLCALIGICALAYAISVLNPGPVRGLIVDRASRQVDLVCEGLLAVSTRHVAFENVADLRIVKRSDDDGYPLEVPELTTRQGVTYVLPQTITATDIAAARRVLGLAAARHANTNRAV
jgi:hypothetical protein